MRELKWPLGATSYILETLVLSEFLRTTRHMGMGEDRHYLLRKAHLLSTP